MFNLNIKKDDIISFFFVRYFWTDSVKLPDKILIQRILQISPSARNWIKSLIYAVRDIYAIDYHSIEKKNFNIIEIMSDNDRSADLYNMLLLTVYPFLNILMTRFKTLLIDSEFRKVNVYQDKIYYFLKEMKEYGINEYQLGRFDKFYKQKEYDLSENEMTFIRNIYRSNIYYYFGSKRSDLFTSFEFV